MKKSILDIDIIAVCQSACGSAGITANGSRLCVRLRSVGIERSGSLHKTAVSCCFLLLVISTLENILKISLKKFAESK